MTTRAFFVLVRMRALDITRSTSSLVLFLALPLILLAVVAIVFANGHPFERREIVVVGATTPFGSKVANQLATEPELRVVRVADVPLARAHLRTRTASAMVIVVEEVGQVGERPSIDIVTAPNERIFAQGLASSVKRSNPQTEIHERAEVVPRWGYVHYLFPGLLTFSVLLAGLFGMGSAMVRFRSTLFLKKLATTPLSRSTFVAAQISARALLVLAQVALMMAAANIAFDLPLTITSAGLLVVITILGLLTFSGVGFALASVVKSEALVVDLINALTVPLVFFSEIFFPLSELPRWLGNTCSFLPSTFMVRLTRDVVLFGVTDVSRLAPGLFGLVGWMIVTYGIAIVLFKWHR